MNQQTEQVTAEQAEQMQLPPEVMQQMNDCRQSLGQALVGIPTSIGVAVMLDIIGNALTMESMPDEAKSQGAKFLLSVATIVANHAGLSAEDVIGILEANGLIQKA